MSESQIPAYVDTRKVFPEGAAIAGNLSLKKLELFQEYLSAPVGSVKVELFFRIAESGQRQITGRVAASVQVYCQRCLAPLGIELADDIRLVLLRDEAKAADLEPNFDPWICEGFKLELATIIEEQLILCLPIVSYHSQGECANALNYQVGSSAIVANADDNQTKSPFSILKELKKTD